jgi:hypothetical protein
VRVGLRRILISILLVLTYGVYGGVVQAWGYVGSDVVRE